MSYLSAFYAHINILLHCRISCQSCEQKYFITWTRKGVFAICIQNKYPCQPAYLRSFCVNWVGLLLSTFKMNYMYYTVWWTVKILSTYAAGSGPWLSCMSILKARLILTLVLLNPNILCLGKQCRSRSVGFWRSQLIWICTVCHWDFEFVSTTRIK